MPIETGCGYSTQARLSLEIARLVNAGRINLWFASEFNATENAATSNPYWIYGELDTAAKTGYRNEKTSNLQANLLRWVQHLGEAGMIEDHEAQVNATVLILHALQGNGFRPVVLGITGVEAEKREEPDEFLAHSVRIEGGPAQQVLPWPGVTETVLEPDLNIDPVPGTASRSLAK